jgi:cell division protein FtsB
VSDGGHRTSSIPRPAAGRGGVATSRPPRRRTDLTRPIPRSAQIVRRSPSRWILGTIAVLIALALAAAVFVLPVRAWMNQRQELGDRREQLDVLDETNNRLQAEVDRLQTPEGISEAARSELGYIAPGERRLSLTELPGTSTDLPPGWPYDVVESIVAVRAAPVSLAPVPDPAAVSTTAPDGAP